MLASMRAAPFFRSRVSLYVSSKSPGAIIFPVNSIDAIDASLAAPPRAARFFATKSSAVSALAAPAEAMTMTATATSRLIEALI